MAFSSRRGEGDQVGRRTPARGVHPTVEGSTILFCTVCAAQPGADWCSSDEVLQGLLSIWSDDAMRWRVGDFVLMPDHLHFFCSPSTGPWVEVERWTSFWKDRFAKEVAVTHPDWRWQRGLFHHRLRSEEEYQSKLVYTHHNPVRAGLVDCAEDWPWRGRTHPLRF